MKIPMISSTSLQTVI